MTYNPEIHHRRSIRLRDYDYASGGVYFVTICTWERECLFGEVLNGSMLLNGCGEFVWDEWLNTAALRPNIELDEFIIMPNHFHGIICLTDTVGARRAVPDNDAVPDKHGLSAEMGTARRDPTYESFGKPVSGSMATIIRSFKSAATKRINELRNNPGCPVWQRNYYERVLRIDDELTRAREYIVNNPLKWALDKENPVNKN